MKEIEKSRHEERAAFLQSINTKEDFQRVLTPVVEAINNSPRLNIPAYHEMKSILMRGHQMLEPDAFWEAIDSVGISRQDAMAMVKDEIQAGTARAINAPFHDYLEDILRRVAKLSREMKAGKHDQEIFRLKFRALYMEFLFMASEWDKRQPGRPADATPTIELFKPIFERLSSWAE